VEGIQKFSEVLALLWRHRVEFVVVGGVAAVLEGAPVITFDVDIVPNPEEANLERLLGFLDEIEATYMDLAGREIRPDLEKLRSNRMNLLKSRLGRLDVAAEIGEGLRYSDLLARSSLVSLGEVAVRVLNLETVIASKEAANRAKDHAVLPTLRETLRLNRLKDESGR
jgi:hypothetical protein